MIDFVEFVVSQLKQKALSKDDAIRILRQFSQRSENFAVLHPLLQFNTSDFERQSYSSVFTGEEFFLRDHRVTITKNSTHKILPAVAYLEMARKAVALAHGLEDNEQEVVELLDVVWVRPLLVDDKKKVHIELYPLDDSKTEFEVYTLQDDQFLVHCKGRGALRKKEVKAELDFHKMQDSKWSRRLDSETLYKNYDNLGLHYGPAWQSVVAVDEGENGLLTELRIPDVCKADSKKYFLHPTLADGALQSAMALIDDLSEINNRPILPFTVKSVVLNSPCSGHMYALLRPASDSDRETNITKIDLDLYDNSGNLCVIIRGFTSREINTNSSSDKVVNSFQAESKHGTTLLASHQWQIIPEDSKSEKELSKDTNHHMILVDLPKKSVKKFKKIHSDCELENYELSGANVADKYAEFAGACFDRIRAIIRDESSKKVFLQIIYLENDNKVFEGILGLLTTANLENPLFFGQLLLVDSFNHLSSKIEKAKLLGTVKKDSLVRCRGDEFYRRGWFELESQGATDALLWKENGTYLITGGLGGLGIIFAKEILSKEPSANIALTGRSDLDSDRKFLLEKLKRKGANVTYYQVNIANLQDTKSLVNQLIEEHGRINGFIHCAGIVDDNLIRNKTVEKFGNVLEPKVNGAFNIDEATKYIALDFFVLFSSAAALGNIGQSDYASANGFLDSFSGLRNKLVAEGERCGKTMSINWPLWQAGGMQLEDAAQTYLHNHYGMSALSSAVGIDIFYQCFRQNQDQVLVAVGNLDKLRQVLFQPSSQQQENLQNEAKKSNDLGFHADSEFLDRVRRFFSRHLSELLKLPANRVDPFEKLEKYGIDSILVTELTNTLEVKFGELPKTLFFEYQTIDQVAKYFVAHHRETLSKIFGNEINKSRSKVVIPSLSDAQTTLNNQIKSDNKFERKVGQRRSLLRSRLGIANDHSKDVPIAIVGLSGRYPESDDIAAFWENIQAGYDCITEVPGERWDWQEYFSDDRLESGCHYSKWGGFISGVDEFDPLFFNIAPAEAEAIDPQERLFLQHAWMAVEDAGYTRETLKTPNAQNLAGQVGVYVGVMYSEYQLFGAENSASGQRKGIANSFSSIANRVSYILDVHGPSIAMDTMCSSSLTAIHIACQDLKVGKTSLAISGGVNISIHPNKYLILSQGQFISSDGHCQSFGEGGDGYIPGEGVGAVVLKRLSEAEADRNHIYGIIKGSALNHGGKTNGYTVPNLNAQADVIKLALADANTDPRHISYIEAHGTGTKLGDPIEIAALTRAFSSGIFASSPQAEVDSKNDIKSKFLPASCFIGSVKSNIGHCESAAGIAGLTKILLQMKYRKLVPSLHSKILNPNIDFSKTPFTVNQKLRIWERPNIDGFEIPRIAGLSSFGAGGANAHLIVQEFVERTDRFQSEENQQDLVAVLLSARTNDQLRQKLLDLVVFLQDSDYKTEVQSNGYLNNLAYTLQVGREPLEERIGLLVRSTSELVDKLHACIRNDSDIEDVYRGQVRANKDTLSLFNVDEDLKTMVGLWLETNKLLRLLELWVKGLDVDWRKLHKGQAKALLSLPTYPFAKTKYWITHQKTNSAGPALQSVLHPLVHINTSNLEAQKFMTTFSGKEFFLRGHQIKLDGDYQKVLPAVVYLEMAREAAVRSIPGLGSDKILELCNVVWLRPFIPKSDINIFTELSISEDTTYSFTIFSESGGDKIVYCTGDVKLVSHQKNAVLLLDEFWVENGDVEALYQKFSELGLYYGPELKSINAIGKYQGQLAALLVLPQSLLKESNFYQLHPSIMDGALQAAMALPESPSSKVQNSFIPFSLQSLVINSHCQPEMIAVISAIDNEKETSEYATLNINLYNREGTCCVRMQGLTSVSLKANRQHTNTQVEVETKSRVIIFSPTWRAKK